MQLPPRFGEQSFDLFCSIIVDWLYLLHVLHTNSEWVFSCFQKSILLSVSGLPLDTRRHCQKQ
jgi:hypothetical protein